MKIIKEDQNLMITKDQSIFAFLIGGLFTLIGFLAFLSPNLFEKETPLWLILIFILVGLFIIFANKTTTIEINKITKKITVQQKTLLTQKSENYEISPIKQIELRQSYSEDDISGTKYLYRLAFILNNGKELPLGSYRSLRINFMGKLVCFEQRKMKTIGIKIANFLNIPFEERGAPTVKETLSVIKETVQKQIKEAKKD